MSVYEAINRVTAVMASEGLSKSRKNDQQGYRFRGIDDVYNVLSRHLADAKLCILPRVLSRAMTERPTKSGGVSTYVVLDVEFDLVSAVDGSKHTIRTMGEAMDSADKATNKAMSAAMKYAMLQGYQIPTEGDNDADASHIEPAAKRSVEPDPVEREIADMFASAKTSTDVAAAEAKAAKAVSEKKIVNGARERLLRHRSEAIARLEAR
jgi:hypothetical protein